MFKTVIPGYYLFHSRLKLWWERVSWLLTFPVVVVGITFLFSETRGIAFLVACVVTLAVWVSVYELGYLENDYVTVTTERQATLRLQPDEIAELDDHYPQIVYLKILLAIVLLGILVLFRRIVGIDIHVTRFAGLLVLMRFVFYLHNKARSRWNLASFLALYILKFTAVAFAFVSKGYVCLFVTGVLIFPVPRIMEYATTKKFGLPRWRRVIGNFDVFRPIYYSSVFILCLWLAIRGLRSAQVALPLFAYLAIFRILALFMSRVRRTRASSERITTMSFAPDGQ